MVLNEIKRYTITILFIFFIIFSYYTNFQPGKGIFNCFKNFALTMLKFIPAVFILIGLFEVWVDRTLIEKYLGDHSNLLSYGWAILLAGTTIGGLYVAFPVAYSLKNKGASLRIVFTYIGAAAIARVPMTLFEASFVGIKFTVIRLSISIPLVIISSILLEKHLKSTSFNFKSIE